MLPAIAPGDWLLVDPTTRRWPRRGSVVVVREPDSGDLAIKRVAAGPGDRVPFADGYLILAEDEAWLMADADEETARDAGYGEPIDSRRRDLAPLGVVAQHIAEAEIVGENHDDIGARLVFGGARGS